MTIVKNTVSLKRPLLIRLLPARLRIALWSRIYRGQHAEWAHLYDSAELSSAPRVSMRLLPGDVISDSIAFTGTYEYSLTQRVRHLARSGGIMLEVGANLGYFSLIWVAQRAGNSSIAFEASPRNIEYLRDNIARNGFDERVIVVPLAAGAKSGSAGFDVGPPAQTGWGGFTPSNTSAPIQVAVVRVDEYVTSDQPISLLKIDVEGADTWVLHGCESLLKRKLVREIWYEQNKPRMRALGVRLDDAEKFLRGLDYVATPRTNAGGEVVEWSAVLDCK